MPGMYVYFKQKLKKRGCEAASFSLVVLILQGDKNIGKYSSTTGLDKHFQTYKEGLIKYFMQAHGDGGMNIP